MFPAETDRRDIKKETNYKRFDCDSDMNKTHITPED